MTSWEAMEMARAWAALCCLALLFSLVLLTPAKIAHASANVEALVEPPSVSIHIALKGVNASLYALMRSHPKAFNETTVPEAVKAFMLANGYEEVNYTETTIGFDDATWTVEISFRLAGDDVLVFHYNRTTMAKVYELNVLWRKADVVAREGAEVLFKLNFSAYFSAPLKEWEQVNYTLPGGEVRLALRLESESTDGLDPIFLLVLPKGARLLEVREDEVLFELPPGPGELFMATPFWPLIAIAAITGIAVFYRKAAVRWVRPGEKVAVPAGRREKGASGPEGAAQQQR